MVLIELLGEIIPEEIIVGVQPLTLILSPLHILPFASISLPVIHQAQYHIHTMPLGLRYHKIQSLHKDQINKLILRHASLHANKWRWYVYFEHVLIVFARGSVKGSVATITESPCPDKIHPIAWCLLEGIGHLVSRRRVASHVHHPVCVEPIGVERAPVHDEMRPPSWDEAPRVSNRFRNGNAGLQS